MFGNENKDGLTQVKFADKNIVLNVFWALFKNSSSGQKKTSGNRGFTPPCWIQAPAYVWSNHGLKEAQLLADFEKNCLK